MTTQKLEYDAAVGGEVVLANHVPTYRYAASAVKEIRSLLHAIKHPTATKLAFQRLPKHMRRRAMSHHPKRLPRKYRATHCAQMAKSGKPQPTKRPSRKHRRRPKNLLREYLRRQRRHVWLETHIWHARRFHMIERWGYRLPYASCDKTFRACYRASAQHCLLQDISFHVCLQLKGTLDDIRLGFMRLTSDKCGLGITARTYISGRREGNIDIFRDSCYPEAALGRVSFMWRPLDEENSAAADQTERMLWLWLQPSAYQVILEELIKIFALKSTKYVKTVIEAADAGMQEEDNKSDVKCKDSTTQAQVPKKSAKTQRRLQFMTKTLAYERVKCYKNETSTLELTDLKDTMNRFRLTGPLSQSVLSHVLKPMTFQNTHDDSKKWLGALESKMNSLTEAHAIQSSYWQKCSQLKSPTELMSNVIIALNVEDPRIHRPKKRTKALPNSKVEQEILLDTPACLAHSCLWDAEIRDHICEHLTTTQEYCELRAKHALVPGASCQFEKLLQPMPVLLIQRPGSQQAEYKRLGYGCGWDIIIPAGYGMPTWLSLIMWGAKAGGLRETDSIARELGTEQHLPDTIAGLQQASQCEAEQRAKYFRLPPNKRNNYRRLAIVSPFRAPFAQLVRDWLPSSSAAELSSTFSFHILRDRNLLQQLNAYVLQKTATLPAGLPTNCLIPLQLRMLSRGNCDSFAIICLPTAQDFKRNLRQRRHKSLDPVLTEQPQPDLNCAERKSLRSEHKKLLKRLRARRVREKRKKQETSNKRVYIRSAGTSDIIATQFKRMCALWLPEDCAKTQQSVRRQCSREVFGYITLGSFSFIEATVSATGYVTSGGLTELMKRCKAAHLRQASCLVRSTDSPHYRFACFQINVNV